MMNTAEIKEPALGGGFSDTGALNVRSEYTEESASCQDAKASPAYTESQKNILAMDAKATVSWVREGQRRGWSGRYLKNHVWGAFWRVCYMYDEPEVDAMFARVDSAVAVVFPDEVKLNFAERRDYWAKQGHLHPEHAAACERNGNTLSADIHKECATARGEIQAKPDARLIAYRCLQLGRQLATQGRKADEPLWFATLKILAHCTPDLTRECSCGHPKFNESEYLAKVARIHDENLKPSTCGYFNNLNPAGCVGCVFVDLHCPISLGYENLPRTKRGAQ